MRSHFAVAGMFLSFPGVLYAVDLAGPQATVNNSPTSMVSILQILTYLVLVILIIVGIAWMLRRFGRINSAVNGDLKVLAGLSVGQRERIVLVQAGSVQLLLGVAPGHVQTLHIMDRPLSTEEKTIRNDSFIGRFNDEIRKKMLS